MTMNNHQKPDFNAYAAAYDKNLAKGLSVSGENKDYFAQGRVLWLLKRLEKMQHHGRNIMDYGCGTGSSTPYLFDVLNATTLTGIDISEDSLAIARDRHATLQATYLQPSQYMSAARIDLVFCNGVFHHIPQKKRLDALLFIHDSLKPGGIFSFWENNPWNPGTRWVMSRIPFDRDAITITPPEARTMLKQAGFETTPTDFLFVFPRVLKWLRPLEPYLASWRIGAQYHILCRKPQLD